VRQDETAQRRGLGTAERRILARFAEVVCPPHMRAENLTHNVVTEFESLLEVLPPALRWSVRAGMVAFDQGARLYPPAHGRRFARLTDDVADAYFRARAARDSAGIARIKGLVVMCYYELPEVKEQLGYQPDAYIAAVSRRRLASYGPLIRAGEAALLAPGPGTGTTGDAPQGQP